MFKWYSYCWSKFFVFKGRASRAEFWSFVVISAILPVILYLLYLGLENSLHQEEVNGAAGVASAIGQVQALDSILYTLMVVWGALNFFPYIAVLVRRLHDRGHTGWWVFWSWVFPFLQLFVLIFVLLGSEPVPNQYGVRAPRSPEDDVPDYYQIQAKMWSEFENKRQN
ncbi:MAG: DUF805 domain-containing protein [Burkholderiales bacterium]|nr:DUF805 domain-containing protein [Burkholderiales bacterium]